MLIWPAIDVRGGQCVRLRQGDYAQETVYGTSPAEMAEHWRGKGAKRLHLVDLDGAKEGATTNFESIRELVEKVAPFVLKKRSVGSLESGLRDSSSARWRLRNRNGSRKCAGSFPEGSC